MNIEKKKSAFIRQKVQVSIDTYIAEKGIQQWLSIGSSYDSKIRGHFRERSQGLQMAVIIKALCDQQAIDFRKITKLH
jgi:hypothetical protein